MKWLFKTYMDKIKHTVGFLLFLTLIWLVFLSLTYLFRENHYSSKDRISVVGIKEEVPNSLDVIYIGGSAAFVYWEPLKAYNDCGFTSYDLAANTIQAENILAYIKYARKYQEPDLYIIDARAFQYYTDEGSEIGLRITSDAFDIGINRAQLIHEYLMNHTMDTDEIALYWDIAKYHTNYDALASPASWRLIDNEEECPYKGCQLQTLWQYLDQPEDFQTDQRSELIDNSRKTLDKLLCYCDDNNLNVLFVVCPYYITQDQYAIYNTISDIVSEHGYGFLNANDYYNEIGIDFAKDFYNINHVNSLGAEKYTSFLEQFLVENYNLPDHRKDESYSDWGKLAISFSEESIKSQNSVKNLIAEADEGILIGDTIRESENLAEWGNLVNDSRYTLISVGNGSCFNGICYSDKKMFNQLGLSDLYDRDNYISTVSAGKMIDSNRDGQTTIHTKLGQVSVDLFCDISNNRQDYLITIDGDEYSYKSFNGLKIMVLDNHYGTIIDSVILTSNDEKRVLLNR